MDIGTILSTILFLGPGFLVQFISEWIEEPICEDESKENYLTKSFIFSFLILVLNILVLKLIFKINIDTLLSLIDRIYSIKFFICYCLLTSFMSLLIATLKPYVIKFCVSKYNKLMNKKTDRQYTTYSDLWNLIFYNSEFDVSKHVFIIEKSGIRITQGFIKNVSPKGRNKKNVIFEFTDVVKNYFDDKDFAEKNLSEVVKEYYDFDSDVLIKAYKAETILSDINNKIASAEYI